VSVTVRIPTPLRAATGGQSSAQVDGGTVGEVFAALTAAHPDVRERILDDSGKVRRFVNVFVDDEDIRFLQGLDTAVPDGGTVSIIPAVAGG
jgi:molybdopterin converting factor small subunit